MDADEACRWPPCSLPLAKLLLHELHLCSLVLLPLSPPPLWPPRSLASSSTFASNGSQRKEEEDPGEEFVLSVLRAIVWFHFQAKKTSKL